MLSGQRRHDESGALLLRGEGSLQARLDLLHGHHIHIDRNLSHAASRSVLDQKFSAGSPSEPQAVALTLDTPADGARPKTPREDP